MADDATSPLHRLMTTKDRLPREGDADVVVLLSKSGTPILRAKSMAGTAPTGLAELTDEKFDELWTTLTTIRGIGIGDEDKYKNKP